MKEKIDIKNKKWQYFVIEDDTEKIFQKFSEIYDKNREAARYFILNKKIYSTRIVAFQNKNIIIITNEQISYGVSVTLKRYKSTKIIEKYWIDINKGIISKYNRGKFVPCTPKDISINIKKYIVSKIPWIDFVFKLDLTVTMGTIVTKKLYSQKKLLSWFWGTNYPTALRLHSIFKNNNEVYLIRTSLKNIRNINNINFNIFSNQNSTYIFTEALHLAIKTMQTINAAWSENRLKSEIRRMNRIMIDKVYVEFNEALKIDEIFFPILDKLNSYFIPKDTKDLSKLSWNFKEIEQCYNLINDEKLILKSDNEIIVIGYNNRKGFYVYTTYYYSNSTVNKSELIDKLNRFLILYKKMEERRNKIIKIKSEFENNEIEDVLEL